MATIELMTPDPISETDKTVTYFFFLGPHCIEVKTDKSFLIDGMAAGRNPLRDLAAEIINTALLKKPTRRLL